MMLVRGVRLDAEITPTTLVNRTFGGTVDHDDMIASMPQSCSLGSTPECWDTIPPSFDMDLLVTSFHDSTDSAGGFCSATSTAFSFLAVDVVPGLVVYP